MGLVYSRTDSSEGRALARPSAVGLPVVPKSGIPEWDGGWFVYHNGQRHRATLRRCEGCGQEYLCSSGTKRNKRRFCTSACGNRHSPTQRGYGKPAGSTYVNDDGYVREKTADGRWIGQHRAVMERLLGRPLRDDETVHHKDGDRQNNHPSNLQVRRQAHGRGQVVRCVDCGSSNVAFAEL